MGGLGTAVGGFGEWVLSPSPALSSPLSAGQWCYDSQDPQCGEWCHVQDGGVRAVWDSDPYISPQPLAEGTLGSISEAAVGSMAWKRADSPISHQGGID